LDISRQLPVKIPNGTFQPSPQLKQWQTKLSGLSKTFHNSENSRYSKNKDIAGTYDSQAELKVGEKKEVYTIRKGESRQLQDVEDQLSDRRRDIFKMNNVSIYE
jgi:hypothetical protein